MKHHAPRHLGRAILTLSLLACASTMLPGQSWVRLSPTGQIPIPGAGEGGAAYDPGSDTLLIFGGGTVGAPVNTVWTLSHANRLGGPANWTQLSPTGTPPTPRKHHSLVYDPGSNRLIVFGGCSDFGCASLLNDTWVLSNANGLEATTPEWFELTPAGTPPAPRAAHTAVFDPASNRMVVFGGCTGSSGCDVAQNDSWVLTDATGLGGAPTWLELSPAGGPPGPRNSQTAIFDPNTNRMTVFGGVGGNTGTTYGDVWVLTGANGLQAATTWIQLNPAGAASPGTRYNHTTIYEPAFNRLITFSGVSGGGVPNDTWALSHANGVGGSPTWTQLSPGGTPPSGRQASMSAFDAAHSRMMLFGGDSLTDSWVLVNP